MFKILGNHEYLLNIQQTKKFNTPRPHPGPSMVQLSCSVSSIGSMNLADHAHEYKILEIYVSVYIFPMTNEQVISSSEIMSIL